MLCSNTLYIELLSQGILVPCSTKHWLLQLLFLRNTIAHGRPDDVTAHAIARRSRHQPNITNSTQHLSETLPHLLHANRLEEDSNKENQLPGSSSPPKKRKYKKQRTTDQKLCEIFKVIHDADWAFSDFLYFVFRHEDAEGEEIQIQDRASIHDA
jgi:hypothetical protein